MSQSTAAEAVEGQVTTGTDRERIIRKIKRCLALSESANENEAEMAMRQAQAMMRTYRLSEIDLHVDSVDCEIRQTGIIRMASWQRNLAATAAAAFGCKCIIKKIKNGSISFEFIGVMPSAELAAYAYDSLLTQVKAARKRFKNKMATSRQAADDFCIAWVYSVGEKISQFARENQPVATLKNTLVVIQKQEEEAITQWIAARYEKVVCRKETTRKNFNSSAFQQGIQDGQQANLNHAVSRTNGDQLMIY